MHYCLDFTSGNDEQITRLSAVGLLMIKKAVPDQEVCRKERLLGLGRLTVDHQDLIPAMFYPVVLFLLVPEAPFPIYLLAEINERVNRNEWLTFGSWSVPRFLAD